MRWHRLGLINWGVIESGVYQFGDMTMLHGRSGIGKTTIVDAVQLVHTANIHGIASYNSAQEGATEKKRNARRTPAEYALGADDGSFARPDGSVSFVILSFEPSKDDRKKIAPLTAIVALEAALESASERRRSAVLRDMQFAIVEGTVVPPEAFQVDEQDVIPLSRLQNHLRDLYPGKVHFYKSQGAPKEFLTRLQALLSGMDVISVSEATDSARAWVKTIGYRKLSDANDLIRNEVLEELPLTKEIQLVCDALATLSEVTEEGRRLAETKKKVETIVKEGASARKNIIDFAANQYADPLRRIALIVKEESEERKKLNQYLETERTLVLDREKAKKDREARQGESDQLGQARLAIPGATHVDALEKDIERERREYAEDRRKVQRAIETLVALYTTASEIQAYRSPDLALRMGCDAVGKAMRSLRDRLAAQPLDQFRAMAFAVAPDVEDLATFCEEVDSLEKADSTLREALEGAEGFQAIAQRTIGASKDTKQKLELSIADLRRRRADILKGGADYDPIVRQMVDMLNREHPAAKPKVLCDLIEPLPGTQWMPAIEGFIGAARFNIVVAEGEESKATRKLLEHRARSNVRVVQNARVIKESASARVDRRSIVHELVFKHPTAESFMRLNYGNALKFDSDKELEYGVRGVTVEGLATQGYTLYPCRLPPELLVFGEAARRDSLQNLKSQQERLQSEADAIDRDRLWIQAITQKLRLVERFDGASAAMRAMVQSLRNEASLRERFESLDLTELRDIDERVTAKRSEIKALDEQLSKISDDLIDVGSHLKASQDRLNELVTKSDREAQRKIAAEEVLYLVRDADPAIEPSEIYNRAEELADRTTDPEQTQGRVSGAVGNYIQARARFAAALLDYNASVLARPSEIIRYDEASLDAKDAKSVAQSYSAVVVSLNVAEAILRRYDHIEIENNQQKLEQARKSFNSTLVTSLCSTVKDRIDRGLDQINRINDRLAQVKFGGDWFEIKPENAKNFWHYYEFFNAVSKVADVLDREDLFTTSRVEQKHKDTLYEFVRLLQAKNAEQAQKELVLISDYRNYRDYDMLRHTRNGQSMRISDWGQRGSGGQLETAGYVLRFTVLTNKLKHFDRRPAHMRSVILDEAFQAMDEERTRAMIRFVRDDLNLQLVLAMPLPKVPQFLDEFDTEFGFSQISAPGNGELNYASAIDVRDLTEEIGPLWEEHRKTTVEKTLKSLADV